MTPFSISPTPTIESRIYESDEKQTNKWPAVHHQARGAMTDATPHGDGAQT